MYITDPDASGFGFYAVEDDQPSELATRPRPRSLTITFPSEHDQIKDALEKFGIVFPIFYVMPRYPDNSFLGLLYSNLANRAERADDRPGRKMDPNQKRREFAKRLQETKNERLRQAKPTRQGLSSDDKLLADVTDLLRCEGLSNFPVDVTRENFYETLLNHLDQHHLRKSRPEKDWPIGPDGKMTDQEKDDITKTILNWS